MQHDLRSLALIAIVTACAVDEEVYLIDDIGEDDTDAAGTVLAATVRGPGPLSGYEWFTGHWVNGDDDRNRRFEVWRDMPADSVTQSMPGKDHWYEHAGCTSEQCVDDEIRQPRATFAPTFAGVFTGSSWKSHVWGGYPATDHRQRLIHLGWMDTIPRLVGNPRGTRPTLWRDIKNGAADKYMFLLGRKFAWLDAQQEAAHGAPAFPMTFDITYEWTLQKHPSYPGGDYPDGSGRRSTYMDFPYGWARMVRVFKEGYKYQRGTACPYNFAWRPQLVFPLRDLNGEIVEHDRVWPNRVRNWTIASDVRIHGITVLPAGPMGRQADLLCLSWHDSASARVRGSSATASGNNWAAILGGSRTHWGLQEAADFALGRGVKLCMPEWGPRRGDPALATTSTHPGDVVRFTHAFMRANRANLSYENVFDMGDGALDTAWRPTQPLAQEPGRVYRNLWKQ